MKSLSLVFRPLEAVKRNNLSLIRFRWRFSSLRHFGHTPADDPNFLSIVDKPPKLVKVGRKHNPGVILLVLIPITAFTLGTWQVFRLNRKVDMISKFEDRLLRTPLPLPPQIDPSALTEFDYRRVRATGILRHDQEMLIGPRIRDGNNGYLVVTPLERGNNASTILINRGWIAKKFRRQQDRKESLPTDKVELEGLLREPWKKNMFTPANRPDIGEFYFPDVQQMADLTGSQPVWIEETMEPDLLTTYDREAKGIPIGRLAEVHLRNNHAQYIFTWYALSAATSIMFWMIIRKPPSDIARRIRRSNEW